MSLYPSFWVIRLQKKNIFWSFEIQGSNPRIDYVVSLLPPHFDGVVGEEGEVALLRSAGEGEDEVGACRLLPLLPERGSEVLVEEELSRSVVNLLALSFHDPRLLP